MIALPRKAASKARAVGPRPCVDNAMVKALARAFRWRKMLDTGVHATLEDLARAKGVNATYVSRVLRLMLLAPEIVEAILDGRQPAELQLDDLLRGFPLEWDSQASGAVRLLVFSSGSMVAPMHQQAPPARAVASAPNSPRRAARGTLP